MFRRVPNIADNPRLSLGSDCTRQAIVESHSNLGVPIELPCIRDTHAGSRPFSVVEDERRTSLSMECCGIIKTNGVARIAAAGRLGLGQNRILSLAVVL